MTAIAEWYDPETQRVIVLRFEDSWNIEDYDRVIRESAEMLQSVSHPVGLIIDFSRAKAGSFSAESFRRWQQGIKLWRKIPSYADFWISVEAQYWSYFLIWVLSRIYNPTHMQLASSAEEAYQQAIQTLDKLS